MKLLRYDTSITYTALLNLLILIFLISANGCKKEETYITTPGSDLTNPAIQPLVTSTYPLANSTGPFKNIYNRGDGSSSAHFVIVLNKLIPTTSPFWKSIHVTGFDRPVVVRLQERYIYPIFKTGSTTSAYYDNILSFNVYDSIGYYYSPMVYRIGQTYTVTINGSLEDINGNHLAAPYSFSFTPEPYFRVITFSPNNASTDVPTTSTPGVVFNSPVAKDIAANLQLTPYTQGNWTTAYYDSFSVYFSATRIPYPYNTSYAMLLSPTAHDADGHQIDRGYTSTYSTVAFKVVSTTPRNGDTKSALWGYVEIDASGPIDTGTVRSAFSISPATSGLLYLTPYSGAQYFTFTALNGFRQATTYVITVGSGLKASDGTSISPYQLTFTTDNFKITSTSPGDGATNVYRSNYIEIDFNARIDTGTVRSAFTISPLVIGNLGLYDGNQYFNYFHDQLAANTTYTITVSTVIQTKAGDHLASPYCFSFATGSN